MLKRRVLSRLYRPLVRVYSHPRSGTHFIEKFLAINFYPNKDLSIKSIKWGHWSNRRIKEEGNPYGKLFGSHTFLEKPASIKKGIYIYRDPRAVAYSVWKTHNFLKANDSRLGFSDFLRLKLDWHGSPAFKCEPKLNIFEHWEEHVTSWLTYSEKNKKILVVRYEDLKLQPEKVYYSIQENFFPLKYRIEKMGIIKNKIKLVNEATGLLPNAASVDAWKEVFTQEDEKYFWEQIKNKALISHQRRSFSINSLVKH